MPHIARQAAFLGPTAVAIHNKTNMQPLRAAVLLCHAATLPVSEKAEIVAEFTRVALPKFADRTIVPIIEKVFPIEQVVDAHKMMEADKHFGKIVLKIQ